MLHRRHFLAAATTLALVPAAQATTPVAAAEHGVEPDLAEDQSARLQQALDAAARDGASLHLPAGTIRVREVRFPSNLVVQGVPGATVLLAESGRVGGGTETNGLTLRGIGFAGSGAGEPGATLLEFGNSEGVLLEACSFEAAPGTALGLFASAATVRDCRFSGSGDAAIHALDCRGVLITGNSISGCGNAGVRIWRSESGPDGAIVTNNRISGIDWVGGGNGQNGNGVNVYRADGVIVADNVIDDCAFTAVRLNGTNDCQVSGNICTRSGEVAIFSEFEFSGSVIANNIVDGAATGISITNLDTGGHLAVCSGNIVRNITPASAVNPDTVPIGIFAEAETVISGNTVSDVPGMGIGAGYGSFLRNVVVASNVVDRVRVGIGVSIVEGAGAVRISGNLVSNASDAAIAGMRWLDVAERDLAANAGRYPNVTLD